LKLGVAFGTPHKSCGSLSSFSYLHELAPVTGWALFGSIDDGLGIVNNPPPILYPQRQQFASQAHDSVAGFGCAEFEILEILYCFL